MQEIMLPFVFLIITLSVESAKVWTFTPRSEFHFGPPPSMRQLNCIGAEGEFYFHNSLKANLRTPLTSTGLPVTVPLFFSSNIALLPGCSCKHTVQFMNHRQLFTEQGKHGHVGVVYFNTNNNKPALIGTIAELEDLDFKSSGHITATMRGVDRFYISEVLQERPYPKALVQRFHDVTEDIGKVRYWSQELFETIQFNLKMLQILNPTHVYVMSEEMLQFRPPALLPDARTVSHIQEKEEVRRASAFSFAAMEKLVISAAQRQRFLQHVVVEDRLAATADMAEKSAEYLSAQLIERGLYSKEGLEQLRKDAARGEFDLDLGIVPTM
eukprot:gene24628-29757_t